MAATHWARGKVRDSDNAIISSLADEPKTVSELAEDIGMTNSYVRIRMKSLMEEGRATLKEVKMVKAGFSIVRAPVYCTDETLDSRRARRILPTQNVGVRRDPLVAALFGEYNAKQTRPRP